MKFGVVTGVVVLFAALSCGHEARDFGRGGDAGSADEGGENSAGSDNPVGAPNAEGGGGVGPGPGGGDAGAAGSAGAEPPALCVGKVWDPPPAEDCLSGT